MMKLLPISKTTASFIRRNLVAMNEPTGMFPSIRKWPLILWILAVCLFFPVVASGWAIAIAEGVYGDMEPVFILAGTLLLSVIVSLVVGVSLLVALASFHRMVFRILVAITIFEATSIPLCQAIVKLGQHQREQQPVPSL